MIKISLYNRQGQKLTEVNIKESSTNVDGIMWGTKMFIFSIEHSEYREANIVPAIIH